MQRTRVLMRVLCRAATNRAGLAVSGVVGGTAVLLQSGLLGMMAVAGYLLAFVVDVGRPGRWRGAIQELRHTPPELPSVTELSDVTARDLTNRIERTRGQRASVLSQLASLGPAGVDGAVGRACAMEESACRLLWLLDRVSRYLRGEPIAQARTEVTRLQEAWSSAAPMVRVEYEVAMSAATDRLAALEYAEDCRNLLVGKLEAIVGGLESLPPRLMAVELREATLAAVEGESPMHDLLDELQTLEEASTAVVRQCELRAAAGLA